MIASRFEQTRIEFRQSLSGYLTHFSLGEGRHLVSAHAEESVRRKLKFNLFWNGFFRNLTLMKPQHAEGAANDDNRGNTRRVFR